MLLPIEEIVRSVATENPWWETGRIPSRFAGMPRRTYFSPFKELATNWEVNRAILVMGPRRVGKTVMMQHFVHSLLEEGVEPKSIMYVSIDTPTYTNRSLDFFVDLQNKQHSMQPDDRRYIIFDEVQYLKDWERHLKVLVDRFPNYRFIASGSAAAALKLASTESGAGRFSDFTLPPLTFDEYLRFIKRDDLVIIPNDRGDFASTNDIIELNTEFINYINYGGYPEAVVSDYIRLDAARFIKNDIIDKVLLRDLPQMYGITNIQELNKLFTSLAYQAGQEVSLEALSQSSGGITKPTIAKYIEYLEAAFLMFRVKRVDNNAKTFTRERTFKVFLTNPSMRAALFSPLDEASPAFGHAVENAVFSQWFHSTRFRHLHYARWKSKGRAEGHHSEIDIVNLAVEMRPNWVCEVKWSDAALRRPESWQALKEFIQRRPSVKSGIFTSKTLTDQKEIEGKSFKIVPTALYAYTVGRNTALNRGMSILDDANAAQT